MILLFIVYKREKDFPRINKTPVKDEYYKGRIKVFSRKYELFFENNM